MFINLLQDGTSLQKENIFLLVILVCAILFVFIFVIYSLAKIEKKILWGWRTWSTIIYSLLIIAILIIYCLNINNKDSVYEEFINIVIIPVIVGLVTSLLAPWCKTFFDRNYIEDDIFPAVPQKIYKATNKPGRELQNDLEEQLKQATIYNYSGIDMQIAARSINIVFKNKNKLNEINFIIPSQDALKRVKIYNRTHNNICKSLQTIENSIKKYYPQKNKDNSDRQSLTINFILLNYVPSYHMHNTNEKCWFALVDKNEEGIPYPTTYQYIYNPQNENSMYSTLNAMIKTQLKRFTPLSETPKDQEAKEENDKLKENYIHITLSDGNTEDLSKIETIIERFKKS